MKIGRIRIKTIVSIGILLFVGFVVFSRDRLFGGSQSDGLASQVKVEKVRHYSVNRRNTLNFQNIFAADEVIYFYDRNHLEAYDLEGNKLYSRRFTDDLLLYKGTGDLLVVEREKGNVYQLDNQGEVIRSVLGLGKITDARNYPNGTVVVRLFDGKSILVYNEKMMKTGEIVIESGTILQEDVDSRNQQLLLMVLNESSGEINTDFYIYDFRGNLISKMQRDVLILQSFLFDNIVVTISRGVIDFYDTEFVRNHREYFENIQSITPLGRKVFMVDKIVEDSVATYKLIVYDLMSKKISFARTIPRVYDRILYRDGLYIAYAGNRIDLMNESGAYIYRGEHDKPIERAYLLNNRHFVIVDESTIHLYKVIY